MATFIKVNGLMGKQMEMDIILITRACYMMVCILMKLLCKGGWKDDKQHGEG